ncbi:hypothetical protein C2G38_2173078 [Gigaspora rosea]|uniref:Uncharacterized protein n=1 Tax=Gigaspora rosea TaxID=44941 RepID=A0A397VJV0_9GLOM|nr:hypothetical protein C2G38_2173078 [Gigaspora rosea]
MEQNAKFQEIIEGHFPEALHDKKLQRFDIKPQRTTEDGNKEYKALVYHQESAKLNQYPTCILEVGSQNSNEVKSTNMDNELPRSEFNDLVLDLIDNYLTMEPLVKIEKEDIQELSNVSGIKKDGNKTFTYCQNSAEIRTATETYMTEFYYEKENITNFIYRYILITNQ